MPLATPLQLRYNGGTAGAVIPEHNTANTAAGTIGYTGNKPVYSPDGNQFRPDPNAGTAQSNGRFNLGMNSRYGQFTGIFTPVTNPSAATTPALLRGNNGPVIDLLWNAAGTARVRDQAASTVFALAAGTKYLVQMAVDLGTSSTTGRSKGRITRLSDGVVIQDSELTGRDLTASTFVQYGQNGKGTSATQDHYWDDVAVGDAEYAFLPAANDNVSRGYDFTDYVNITDTGSAQTTDIIDNNNESIGLTDNLTLSWRRTATTDVSWNASSRIAKTQSANWDVSATVHDTRLTTTNWEVLSRVTRTQSVSWGGGEKVTLTRAVSWDVTARPIKTQSVEWAISYRDATSTNVTWALLYRLRKAAQVTAFAAPNLLANPRVSGTGSWAPNRAGTTTSEASLAGDNPTTANRYRVTFTGNATLKGGGFYVGNTIGALPIQPGLRYSAGIWMRSSRDQWAVLGLDFRNSSGTILQQTLGAYTFLPANTWVLMKNENALSPAGSAYAALTGYSSTLSTGVQWVAGDWMEGAGPVVAQQTFAPDYFDGTYPEDAFYVYGWSGTVNSSPSTRGEKAQRWDVVTRSVKTAAAVTWDVRQRIGKTAAPSWHVRARYMADEDAAWDVNYRDVAPVIVRWDVVSRSSTTTSNTWNVSQRVQRLRTVNWETQDSLRLVKGVPVSWDVGEHITITNREVAWDVLVRDRTDQTATWDLQARQIAARGVSWEVSSRVRKTHAANWNLYSRGIDQAIANWNVNFRMLDEANAAWNVSQRTVKTAAANWGVSRRVTKSTQIVWNTNATARVAKGVPVAWDVSSRTAKERPASWAVLARSTTDQAVSWEVNERVQTSIDVRHSVLKRIVQTTDTSWALKARLDWDRITEWNVLDRRNFDLLQIRWDIRRRRSLNPFVSWNTNRLSGGTVSINGTLIPVEALRIVDDGVAIPTKLFVVYNGQQYPIDNQT